MKCGLIVCLTVVCCLVALGNAKGNAKGKAKRKAKVYDLDNNELSGVSLDGTVVSLDLSANNVPECAKGVIIYARVSTGWFMTNCLGNLIMQSGSTQRKLFFRSYKQNALSYNSDYFTLPIPDDGVVTAKIVTDKPVSSTNYICDVQVVGYVH